VSQARERAHAKPLHDEPRARRRAARPILRAPANPHRCSCRACVPSRRQRGPNSSVFEGSSRRGLPRQLNRTFRAALVPSRSRPEWGILAAVRTHQAECVCIQVTVRGRVQGVAFRDSTRREASRLSVAGWVRNRSDGTVEAHFEGPPGAVAEMVAWCHHGPSWAHVEQVETRPGEFAELAGFSVR
jgi:acylphosphatase